MSRIWSHYACITADRQSKKDFKRVTPAARLTRLRFLVIVILISPCRVRISLIATKAPPTLPRIPRRLAECEAAATCSTRYPQVHEVTDRKALQAFVVFEDRDNFVAFSRGKYLAYVTLEFVL
ncbi:MAG: hypothetical protein USCGTAYLOR_02049 [Chromatiales bacterium USCg_Taylor]|nr:MAG: hypothetical protein USCGTAYLOR_02049 [Chromatiales bacterium USCg_Taylor]